MRRRADLSVEVTLEEDDGSALGDGPTPDDGMRAAARRLLTARSGRTVLVAGIVLLLVGVGVTRVTAVLSERRDADALAAAASLPGIAPSLEDPLGESWRSQAQVVALASGVLVELAGTTDRRELHGRDGRTGQVRWATVLPGVSRLTEMSCDLELGPPDSPVLGCLVSAAAGWWAPDEAVPGAGVGRLVLIDLANGALLDDRLFRAPVVGVDAVDRDLVVAEARSGEVSVRRTDPLSGDVRWERRLRVEGAGPIGSVDLEARDGLVVVRGARELAAVLDAGDGEYLTGRADGWGGASFAVPVAVTSGGDGFWVEGADGAGWARYSRAGDLVMEDPSGPARVLVSDELPADVLLVGGDAGADLRAVDAASGTELWRRAAGFGELRVRLDGRLVVLEDRRLVALDVRTGRERWSADLPPADVSPTGAGAAGIVTDGVRVVTLRQAAGAPPDLTAYALRDGGPLWTVRAPRDVGGVLARDGLVLGVGPRDVVGLD